MTPGFVSTTHETHANTTTIATHAYERRTSMPSRRFENIIRKCRAMVIASTASQALRPQSMRSSIPAPATVEPPPTKKSKTITVA
ncbi:MAG TPA: hypothetical protein VF588_11385 [Pyrinomonadaceae bacterium]